MATFWERAVYSVYRMFYLFCLFLFLVLIPKFGFAGGTVVLIVSVSSHSLSFTHKAKEAHAQN